MSNHGTSAGIHAVPARMPSAPPGATSRPCRPGQRRTWLLDRMDPGNAALNVVAHWRLDGPLPPRGLAPVFARLLANHPLLRTRIALEDGEPVQVIEPEAALHIPELDLTGLDEAAALAEAGRLAQIEARTPFDLALAPLLRVTRLRLRDDASIVLVTAHRMVCDVAGLAALAREIEAGGNALQDESETDTDTDTDAALPAESAQRDEAWWAHSLQGLKPFELQADHPRPPVQTASGARASLALEPALAAGVHALARRHNCSLFSTGLAALLALLHRYSGEHDIAVGSPGQSLDSVLLRTDLSGNPTFAGLMARVQATVASAAEHLGTPFDRVVALRAPERDLSRHALFSIHFTLQPAVFTGSAPGGLRFTDLPAPSPGAQYDLNFALVEREGWHLACEYNIDLFDAPTVERMLGHLANLLRAAQADAGQRIGAMTLLGADESAALAAAALRTQAAYPQHLTLPQLFEEQVARTPGAPALLCGERILSYRELDRAANRLAHELQSRGAGRGSRVAICLPRSADLVVALLGVLKAGAAYVPLDPDYPPARLAQILEDAQPALLLGTRARGDATPATVPRLCLDEVALPLRSRPDSAPSVTAAPQDVAYVIYTSGSTGRPKGVQIPHRALTNLLWAMRSAPGLGARDTLLAVTTIAFDIAALELFLPLITGAKLVLAEDGVAADGAALLDLLRRHRATVMQATPVTWQILLESGWRGNPSLKMLCGGEAMTRSLADALLAHGGELWNLYGPTETTIWSSALRVTPGGGPVPLGPPIANTQFHVLDTYGQQAPAGVAGELYIGGDGVALGYVDLPELNAQRFVADPFCAQAGRAQPGARLYRTGDRVRSRAGGELEFLGRADYQVKVRGYRIELGEIESVIRAHPRVLDCVAVAGAAPSGEMVLEAYLVERGEQPAVVLVDSVREALRNALPAYMVPSRLIVLAALPRLPNGKVDRSALPKPGTAPVAAAAGRALGALEKRLATQWRTVLGGVEVGAETNFFEAGGHSLLAVRLLTRIEAEFGRSLTLAALFRHPTIAAQARLLEQGDGRSFDFRQVVSLQAGGSRPPLIAINNTGIYYALSRRLGADQPFTSLQLFDPALPRATLPQSLPQTLKEIAAAYAQLIKRVQPDGPYALLGWCVAGTLAFEVARQLQLAGETVSKLVLFDTLAPGHLKRMPWLRSLLADYAYRLQLIGADWQRARRESGGVAGLADFLGQRSTVIKLLAWLRGDTGVAMEATPALARPLSAEQYDQWLLHYLEDAAAAYEPQPYAGRMTLIRSSAEPAGRFLDPEMGWGPFVEGGIEVAVIGGDHFSIFQEPAVSQMARHLAPRPPHVA